MNRAELAELLEELADGFETAFQAFTACWWHDLAKQQKEFADGARAAAEQLRQERETEYRFTVLEGDDWLAGGSAPTQAEAEREATHYLSQCQSGVATVERCTVVWKMTNE